MENKTNQQKHIKLLFLLGMLLIGIALATTLILSVNNLNPGKTIIILDEVAQIKAAPNKSARTLQEVQQGDVVRVSNQKNHWYKVKDSKNNTGWIQSSQTNYGAPIPGTKQSGQIIDKKVPLTLKPKNGSNIVMTLNAGTNITVTAELAGWMQISYKDVEGWIPSATVKTTSKKKKALNSQNKIYTRQKGTVIRKEANQSSSEIETVPFGEKLTFLTQVDDWYQVLTSDKKVGYVQNWTVNFSKADTDKPYKISPLADKTIMLDPGHGGADVGALSNDERIYEKTITLATAKYVKTALEATGANVILTREDDTLIKLSDITEKEKNVNIDTFISFHYDSSETDNEATGFTTYYYHASDQLLAQAVNTHLEKNLDLTNRGVDSGDFQVIRDSDTASLLLELGYMNNTNDVTTFITKDYQESVAKGVTDGLMAYYAAN